MPMKIQVGHVFREVKVFNSFACNSISSTPFINTSDMLAELAQFYVEKGCQCVKFKPDSVFGVKHPDDEVKMFGRRYTEKGRNELLYRITQ